MKQLVLHAGSLLFWLASCTLEGNASPSPPLAPPDGGCKAGACDAGPTPDASKEDAPEPQDAASSPGPGLFSLEAGTFLPEVCYGCLLARCQDELISCNLDDACRTQGGCAISNCLLEQADDLTLNCIDCACGETCPGTPLESGVSVIVGCARKRCSLECSL